MNAADILIRSDCQLIDSCKRVVHDPINDLAEVDFIVVGGGVAGKQISQIILLLLLEYTIEFV